MRRRSRSHSGDQTGVGETVPVKGFSAERRATCSATTEPNRVTTFVSKRTKSTNSTTAEKGLMSDINWMDGFYDI